MIMLENILVILSAIVTIVVSGLLVRWQDKQKKELKNLHNEKVIRFEDLVLESKILTGKEPEERSLWYLEKRMATFNETLAVVKQSPRLRRYKSVQRKKDIAND